MQNLEQLEARRIWYEHFKRGENFPPQLQPQVARQYRAPNMYPAGWLTNASRNNAIPASGHKHPLGNPFGAFTFPPRTNASPAIATPAVLRNMQQPNNLTLFIFLQNMFQHCNRNKNIQLGNGIKVYISPYFANFHGTQIEGTANISISFLNAINCVVASTATGKWSLPSFASTFTSSLFGLYEERYGIDNIHLIGQGDIKFSKSGEKHKLDFTAHASYNPDVKEFMKSDYTAIIGARYSSGRNYESGGKTYSDVRVLIMPKRLIGSKAKEI